MPPKLGRLVGLGRDFFAVVASEDDLVYGGFGANQAFVLLEESVLVFDSGFSVLQARNLHKKILEVTDKKIRYLLNSHDHSDHVFGNSFFWKKYSVNGLRIVSHTICKDNLASNGPKRIANYRKIPGLKKALDPLEILVPNVTYSDLGMRLSIEGTELVLSHPPTGAHTLGDTMLFFPRNGIAFAGDIVWNRFLPNLEDANLEGWITYLEDLDLETYRKFVPGHGEVCQAHRVVEFRNYLKAVRAKLLETDLSRERKLNQSTLRTFFEIPGTEDWKLRQMVEHNIEAFFR